MKIEPHTLKSLASQLLRDDKATIIKETGLSRVTIDEVFKGESITPATFKVAEAAAKIILERRKQASLINEAAKL
jgi:hypothetical protein